MKVPPIAGPLDNRQKRFPRRRENALREFEESDPGGGIERGEG